MAVSESDQRVYAAVGLALRWAQQFEAEIVTVMLLHGVARGKFTVRADAEAFLSKAEKKPLHQLLAECLARVRFEPDVTGTLEEAREQRNFFVHRFFWERAEAFADESRHPELLDELKQLTELFFSAHKFAEMLRDLYVKQLPTSES